MLKCPACDQLFSNDDNFCVDDGETLVPVRAADQAHPDPGNVPTIAVPNQGSRDPAEIQANRNRFPVFIGAIVFVLMLFGMGYYFFRGPEIGQIAGTGLPPLPVNKEEPINSRTGPDPNTRTEGQRYTINSCGSILDKRTGLEWFVGEDRNVTWYEAQDWTLKISACGGGWRMPAMSEIGSLYDPSVRAGTGYVTRGQRFPARIDPMFDAIGGGSWVWANASPRGENASAFNLNQGKPVEFSALNTSYSTRAFAVRLRGN